MGKTKNKIVIQTALGLEQDAVSSRLLDVRDIVHPESKTIYKIGKYGKSGNEIEVIVGRTDQTNVNAGIETERAISFFKPTYLFYVGVAGGLKDVKIGDVVIGSDVFGYERGKEKDTFLPRPKFGFSSYELEQKAVSYSRSEEWNKRASSLSKDLFPGEIQIFAGTIASGEKVIGSSKSGLYQFLKQACSHALAVEMEGLGFLEACRPYPLIKSLLIRGVSDLVDGKDNSDLGGGQPFASSNATEFLFGLIEHLEIKQSDEETQMREKLVETAPKLYPMGLRENDIWQRAGGDLSMVNLTINGRTQWYDALRLIERGGGGDIDFKLLVKEMLVDFKNNESLKLLWRYLQ